MRSCCLLRLSRNFLQVMGPQMLLPFTWHSITIYMTPYYHLHDTILPFTWHSTQYYHLHDTVHSITIYMTRYTILPFTWHGTQYYHLNDTVHNITCTAVSVGMLAGKTWSIWKTTCPNINLCTTNPTCTGLGLNLGQCGKRLKSNQLSDGMAVDLSGISVMVINSNAVSWYWNELPVITLPSLIWQNVAVQNTESKKFSPVLQWWFESSWYSALKYSVNS
jgi:hypothetical protein